MSDIIANDVRTSYEKAFTTIKKIAEAFPEDKWLAIHGDEYYIPSRIAYHLAGFIDGMIAGGNKDPEFRSKMPFGSWYDGTAETLPGRDAFIAYLDGAVGRANAALASLDDAGLTAQVDPEKARFGATQIAVHLHAMRELSAHTGELNKMLIENGMDDIWV